MNPETEQVVTTQIQRQPYTPPAVILELDLETRAGSPLGLPDPFEQIGSGS